MLVRLVHLRNHFQCIFLDCVLSCRVGKMWEVWRASMGFGVLYDGGGFQG